MKFGIWVFFEKCNFVYNLTRITGVLHEGVSTFLIISSSFLLRLISFSDRRLEKIKRYVICSTTFLRRSYRLWDNVDKHGITRQVTDDNIMRRMSIACRKIKATDPHSECVILLVFPRQEWLRERATVISSSPSWRNFLRKIEACRM